MVQKVGARPPRFRALAWRVKAKPPRSYAALAASMIGREVNEDWVDPYGEFGRELDRVAPSVRFGLELAAWNLYGGFFR